MFVLIVDQIVLSCVDFIMPTFGSLSTTITFLMQRLMLNPTELQKIQSEIDNVVGRGRLPTLDDRIKLNFHSREFFQLLIIVFLVYPIPKLHYVKQCD